MSLNDHSMSSQSFTRARLGKRSLVVGSSEIIELNVCVVVRVISRLVLVD